MLLTAAQSPAWFARSRRASLRLRERRCLAPRVHAAVWRRATRMRSSRAAAVRCVSECVTMLGERRAAAFLRCRIHAAAVARCASALVDHHRTGWGIWSQGSLRPAHTHDVIGSGSARFDEVRAMLADLAYEEPSEQLMRFRS